jgi:UrcA family protein
MMNRTVFAHLTIAALLGATAVANSAQGALAQPADAPEIVVIAPRSLPAPEKPSPYSGAPTVITTVRIPVLYYDLDLKDPDSTPRLMKRIERVAQDACAALDRLYPLNRDADCVDTTVANATPAAKAAIALAAK